MFCTKFDGTTYNNEGTTITHHRHEYITHISFVVLGRTYYKWSNIYFTLTIAFQPSDSILLSDLGPLHLRIPQFPLELLVRVPVIEDRPTTSRSNLKNGSIYMNETKHN